MIEMNKKTKFRKIYFKKRIMKKVKKNVRRKDKTNNGR